MNDQEQQGGAQETQETGPTGPSGAQPQEDPTPSQPTPEDLDQGQDAQPTPVDPAPEPRDQVAEEARRQEELEAQQREHAQRTGGGEIRDYEVEDQRDEHNARVGGGDSQDQA